MAISKTAQPNLYQPNTWSPNGQYLPVAAKNISGILRDTIKRPFRKLEIKRRQMSDALYETNWQDISAYVTKWGSFQISIDDQRLNQFVFSGLNVTVKNDFGEFNPEYDGASMFYGYLTRYRTLVRLSAGYTDGAGNQYPSEPTQGIFIMDADIDIAPPNKEVAINCKSIISPFQETRASEVTGITDSMTSSEIIGKIRDATDGSGNYLFRNFITSTAWDIQATTEIITGLGTTTSREGFSVWEMMNKIAEIENFIIAPTRTGGLLFGDRNPNSTEPVFSFYSAGFRKPNVIKVNAYKEAIDKLFTHVRFKYLEDETSTSYIEAGSATTIDVRSDVWKYGRRTYELENTFFTNTFSAQFVATRLVNQFSNLRNELSIDTVFIPHLEILDRVDVNHREGSASSVMLWDEKDWAADTSTADGSNVLFWASETSASIEFNQKNFKILSKRTNLDTFVTTFNLREAEN